MRKVYLLTLLLLAITAIAYPQVAGRRLYFVGTFSIPTAGVTSLTTNYGNSYTVNNRSGNGGFTDSAFWAYFHPGTGRFYKLNNTTFFTNLSDRTVKDTDTLYIDSVRLIIGSTMTLDVRVKYLELGRRHNSTGNTFRVNGSRTFTMSNPNAAMAITARGVLRLDARTSTSAPNTQIILGSILKAVNTSRTTDISSNGQTISGVTGFGVTAFASQSAAGSGADPYGGFSNLGSLPVVLVSFDAVKQGNGVMVTWKTQQEFNTRQFQVEKSNDGRNYTVVATLDAAGTATTPRSYSYVDNSPLSGITYYRVRIVDLDNKFGFTTVKAVRAVAAATRLGVYPNPAVSMANIVVNATETQAFTVNVFNRNGQLVAQRRVAAGTTAVAMEVSTWPSGDYTVDVQFNDGSRQATKLIVANK